jgi:hypothetical protein
MSMSSNTISLPPGVTISPARETVQQGPNGQNIQGYVFTLTLPDNGAQTSVFVPYTLMTQTDVVAQMFAQRVAAIQAVTNLAG